jgi:hypothetical protein|tara:strand:+ start:83 stop:490 length:408 start_codon:yes stop_codon:yes gene_type:complete
MTGLIYKEVPTKDITHLTRPEFINGEEKVFNQTLKTSLQTYGMRDPVFIRQLKEGTLKITVGNNRMVMAKELGFEKVPCVIKLYDPNNNNLNGRPLTNEEEIKNLFYSKEGLEIKKEDGIIYEVMPKNPQKNGKI